MDNEKQLDESEDSGFKPVEPISWTASEYISHEKSMSWHTMLFVAAGILTLIVFIVSRDILATIVILLSATAMSVYAKKKPSEKSYILNDQGISIDGREYTFGVFRSFSIVEEGTIDSVWLKPLQRFSPTIVIYFPPDEEERIQDVLAAFLPFEEKSLDAIDRLTKRIRF